MSVLLSAVLLAIAVVFFVLFPLVAGQEAPMDRDDEELTDAQHRKKIALMALRDVEYDYHAGKLDEADYLAQKRELSAEALSAIDTEESEWKAREVGKGADGGGAEELAGADEELEAEIAALRSSIREGVVCPQCGHPNPQGSRFCGDCGAALPNVRRVSGGS